MRLLLDTHALIWFIANKARLPQSLMSQFLSPANTLLVSRASLWEVAIKSQLAKQDFPVAFTTWIERLQLFDFEMLEITDAHLVKLSQLPTVKDHRDPFDRLLIAQALTDDLILISRDEKFRDYAGLKLQWA